MNGATRAVTTGVLCLLVLAAGCTSGPGPDQRTSRVPSAAYAETACPRAVVAGMVGDVTCGRLTVVENRAEGTGSVELFVARLTPPEPSHDDPVVIVGTDIATATNYAGISPLAQRVGRPVIFLDPRGTGSSTPTLSCTPTVRPASWEDATGSSAWQDAISRGTQECYAELSSSGIDVGAFGVESMAADVVDLLDALEVDRANLVTYGGASRVSFELMRHHPSRLRSVLMDSPELPGVDPRTYAASTTRDGLDQVLRWCARDAECRMAHPDPPRLLSRALRTVEREPVLVRFRSPSGTTPVRVDAALLVRAARQTMTDGGSSGHWALPIELPRLLEAAVDRDRKRLGSALSDLLGYLGPLCAGYQPKCSPAHAVTEGVANTVLCSDIAPFSSPRRSERVGLPGFAEAYERAWWWETCQSWPTVASDPHLAEPVFSDVPTLVLVGGLAAPTPAAEVRQGIAGLTDASLVLRPTGSHNVIGDDCMLDLRNEWLDDLEPITRAPACFLRRLEW